jgi:adenylosuccinate synthase
VKPSTLPIALESVERVTFYKRDELTTDLICCELMSCVQIWTLHEELPGWDAAIAELSTLPGFRHDWHAHVSAPPFDANPFVAFEAG